MWLVDPGYTIRLARSGELEQLREIERLAAERYEPFGLAELFSSIISPIELLRERAAAKRVWVAVDGDDRPVGFAFSSSLDGEAHLDELDVHPDHGRRGIGTALIETVCNAARDDGYKSITLSTLRSVPFNAPLYVKRSFRVLEKGELTHAMRELLLDEARVGLPMEDRVIMRREL